MSTRIGLNRRKLMPAKMQIEKLTDEIVRLNVNNEALQHRAERAEAALKLIALLESRRDIHLGHIRFSGMQQGCIRCVAEIALGNSADSATAQDFDEARKALEDK